MTHHHHQQQQPFTISSTTPAKLGGRNRGSWKLPLQKFGNGKQASNLQLKIPQQLIINPSASYATTSWLNPPLFPTRNTHRRRCSVWVSLTKPFGAVVQQQSQQLQLQPDFGDPTDRLNPTKRHQTCFPAEKFQVPAEGSKWGDDYCEAPKWNGNGNEIFRARDERSSMCGLAGSPP